MTFEGVKVSTRPTLKMARREARAKLDECDGNVTAASGAFLRWLSRSAGEGVKSAVLTFGARILVEEAHRMSRQRVRGRRVEGGVDVEKQEEGRQRFLRGHARRVRDWMNYPMATGKRLGDCVKAEVVAQRELHSRESDSHAFLSRWFGLVAEELEDGGAVQEQTSNERLEELYRAAS